MATVKIDTTQPVDRTGNRYCGPLVIAAVTGLSTSEAAAKVRKYATSRSRIKGMRTDELRVTLHALGHKTETVRFPKGKGPTLGQWTQLSRSPFTPYIIQVTGHFVIIKGNLFCDTFTKGIWVPLNTAPHMRCRVVQVMQVYI